jgi:uroporphyrinogen-III synthase
MPRAKSATSTPLSGWVVISLRPSPAQASLRRAARKLGASVFALPTLVLQALDARDTLRDALRTNLVIVTSPAAARHAHTQQYLRQKRGQSWLAVGAGTANVLRRIGLTNVHTPPQGNDSSALLAHPLLASIDHQTIGVLTAPGGRDLIVPGLCARGAEPVRADVYSRSPATIAPRRWRQLMLVPKTAAVFVSSEEALDSLWRGAGDDERARLLGWPCIASSTRLQARAKTLGWAAPVLAASALPGDLLAALAAHVAAGRFR